MECIMGLGVKPVHDTFRVIGDNMENEIRGSLIGKHVSWMNQPRSGWEKFGTSILVGLELVVLSISIVGIIAILKGEQISRTLKDCELLKLKQKDCNPPDVDEVVMKTKTLTFNHQNYYAINDDVIWYKSKDSPEAEWKPMYYDGYNSTSKPVEIQADGANLMIRDAKGKIHYKKILEEYRKNNQYSTDDLTNKNNWIDRWFSFPIFEVVYHFFASKRLRIPSDARGWAASHRGIYNHHFEDIQGKKHSEFAMVTTVYLIPEDGNGLLYADPYLTGQFSKKIEGPEPGFVIDAVSASASTIMIFGRDTQGKLKIYTRRVDFDMIGKNPFLAGFYNKNRQVDPNWKEHALPEVPEGANLHISIFQIGEGNDGFKMQLKVNDVLYSKLITDEKFVVS
jgi:hypothetical protein